MAHVTREEVMQYPPREALKRYDWELLEDLFYPKTIAHRMLRYDVEKYNLAFRQDLMMGVVPEHLQSYYVYVLKYDVPAERYYRLLRDARNDSLTHPRPQGHKKGAPKRKSKETQLNDH